MYGNDVVTDNKKIKDTLRYVVNSISELDGINFKYAEHVFEADKYKIWIQKHIDDETVLNVPVIITELELQYTKPEVLSEEVLKLIGTI
jgi:hypothetical protein